MTEKLNPAVLLRLKTITLMTDSTIAREYGISERQVFRMRITHQIPALAKEDYVAKRADCIRRKVAESRRVSWPRPTARSKTSQDALYAPHGGAHAYAWGDVREKRPPAGTADVYIRPLLASPCGSCAALCADQGDPE
ncbi:MAG TPA: hypothetical protein DCW68_00500 [Rhodospirillaceae bacterium]|nr:hypothetical protein [Rhodospirillaceae bacterium]